jgi:hypothetical protein
MRRLVVMVATALLASVACVTATAQEAAPQSARVRVTMSASPTLVAKGGFVTLTGRVRGAKHGKVVIWQLNKKKGSSWKVEARKKLKKKGRFRHTEDVNAGSRYYKACFSGHCSARVLVRMGTPKPKATALSVAGLSTQSIEAGQSVTVTGAATGNLVGQTVYIQAQDVASGKWGSVGSAVVNGDGTWNAVATLTTAGRTIPLRAVFPGSSLLLASSAGAASVTVYGWYYFSDGDPLEAVDSFSAAGSYAVNGSVYPKSVTLYSYSSGSTAEVNVSRACTRFVATVGVNDQANAAKRYSLSIKSDSVGVYTRGGIGLGQANPVDVNITGGLRIYFDATVTAGTYTDGSLVLGDARALCAF